MKDINKGKHETQTKCTKNVNKIIEENVSNLKKEIAMNMQEDYRTPNRLD